MTQLLRLVDALQFDARWCTSWVKRNLEVLEEAFDSENPSRGKFVAKRGFNFEDMTARDVQRNGMPVNGCELTGYALRLVLFALFDVQSDASPN